MSLFGDFEHHLQISVGNYIPNTWVMFNWDIYQPLEEAGDCPEESSSSSPKNPWQTSSSHGWRLHQMQAQLGVIHLVSFVDSWQDESGQERSDDQLSNPFCIGKLGCTALPFSQRKPICWCPDQKLCLANLHHFPLASLQWHLHSLYCEMCWACRERERERKRKKREKERERELRTEPWRTYVPHFPKAKSLTSSRAVTLWSRCCKRSSNSVLRSCSAHRKKIEGAPEKQDKQEKKRCLQASDRNCRAAANPKGGQKIFSSSQFDDISRVVAQGPPPVRSWFVTISKKKSNHHTIQFYV